MSPAEALAVFAAGIGAGTINTIVGSGTLITFPVLLAVGLPPVTANVSNTLGLVPGSISGAIGYRHELRVSAELVDVGSGPCNSGPHVADMTWPRVPRRHPVLHRHTDPPTFGQMRHQAVAL